MKNIIGVMLMVIGVSLLMGAEGYHFFIHPEWTQMQAIWEQLGINSIAMVLVIIGLLLSCAKANR